jgi:hypothetical protein
MFIGRASVVLLISANLEQRNDNCFFNNFGGNG